MSDKDTCCSGSCCGKEEAAEKPAPSGGTTQTYRIVGMDCGSCAQSLENHMKGKPFVKQVRVQFSTGNMYIDHTGNADDIIKEVAKAGYRVIPADGTAAGEPEAKGGPGTVLSGTWNVIVSGVLLLAGIVGQWVGAPSFMTDSLLAVCMLAGGYKPAKSAYYALKSRSLDMNVLMTAAVAGAAVLGEWSEGAMVVWLFSVGNVLQNVSIQRTRQSVRGLMECTAREAAVQRDGQWVLAPVEEVSVGETVLVKPGEKIPLDGLIVEGLTSVNQAPITGEAMPVDKGPGDAVFAGTVNESGAVEIRVTKRFEDAAISRMIHMVEEAQEKKAPTQTYVDRFARIYTPAVFGLALLIMIFPPVLGMGTWADWFYKGLELLVVACPCALVISTPVAIVSAIGSAARNGVLIKGGAVLEKAGSIGTFIFDKTGTLTEGKPKVTAVSAWGISEDELVSIARTIEEYSSHPVAKAVIGYADERGIGPKPGTSYKAIPGKGAQAEIGGMTHYAGSLRMFQELCPQEVRSGLEASVLSLQAEGQTPVLVGTGDRILGVITVSDSVRDTSAAALKELKQAGIGQIVMLTGDNEGAARRISLEAGVDRYEADCLPEDKVNAVKRLQQEGKLVAMVGDGINDAPALAAADIGVAMGGAGTDTAMEAADIVLMGDHLQKLPETVLLSRRALRIIRQNIWFSVIIKAAALVLIFPGWLTLWLAVVSDTGAALAVILNSMRLLGNGPDRKKSGEFSS